MFQNIQVTEQPIFYLFIGITVLLSLGYMWGKRRNTKIHLSAFNAVVNCLKPKDQQFTNIGGLTGYHGKLIPKKNKIFRQIDLTLTLLPRQSWLYLPFSLMTIRTDKLYTTMHFAKKIKTAFSEGHLVEEKFSKTTIGRIENSKEFDQETIKWGEKNFILYTKDEGLKKKFKEFIGAIENPSTLRQVSIVPKEKKAFLFIHPKYGTVANIFTNVYHWLLAVIGTAEDQDK